MGLRLLQISDLHFGPPYRSTVGESVLQLADELKPDAVIVSGDLTQRARRSQFLAAREFLQRLPSVPMLVIPGNHDVPLYRIFERLFWPHGLYREIISPDLNPVLRLPGALIAGIDSTSPHTAISNGRIGRQQLASCREVFRQADESDIRIVVAHHHLIPPPDRLRDRRMQASARAIRVFAELGVELILGGHLHRAFVGNSLDYYPEATRDTRLRDQGIIIVHSGTTTSGRGRGREYDLNSLNLIEVSPQMIDVSHYLHDETRQRFEIINRHELTRRKPDSQ
ncbi:MAG: metallophosphoesterase family protein [Planctomyces sp.]